MAQLLETMEAWLPGHVATGGRILLIAVLTLLALRTIHRVVPQLRELLVARQETTEDGQRIRTLSRVIRYVLTVAVTLLGAMLVLGELGISVAPILGAAGVIGIAVGFGAQSLVKDYFTGFFLLLENQLRIGDVVDAGGKSGTVEELTLRYLRLRDYSGNVHYIPNGNITVVTNMSLGFAYAVIDIGVAYAERIDEVVALMRRVGETLRTDPSFATRILEPLEVAGVEQWADSAVVIRCRFKVAPLEQWSVRREYLARIKAAFDEAGVEIPFPHVKLVYQGG